MKKLNNETLKRFDGLYEKFSNEEIYFGTKDSCCFMRLTNDNLDDLKLLASSIYNSLKGNNNYFFLNVKLEKDKAIDLALYLIKLNFLKIEAQEKNGLIEVNLQNTIHYSVIKKHVSNLLKCLYFNEDEYNFINKDFNTKIGQLAKDKYRQKKIDENNVLLIESLKELPISKTEIAEMTTQDIKTRGQIFAIEESITKNKKLMYKFYITDYTESAIVLYFSKEKVNFKVGDVIDVIGHYEISMFDNEPQISNSKVSLSEAKIKNPYELILDSEYEERVELHVHSTMSQMDGIIKPETIYKNCKNLGIKAIAICDNDNVQNFPAVEALAKENNMKAIYGVELSMLDDSNYKIFYEGKDTYNKEKIIGIDIETTGFSAVYDEVTQISCIKEYKGETSDFTVYVKIRPETQISPKITELTGITKELLNEKGIDVKDALKQLIDFIGDGVLIAHNSRFDIPFIEEKIKRELGIKKSFSHIDTLSMARHFLKSEMKRFSLDKVASKVGVDLTKHHNAKFDTEACFGIYKALYTKYTRNEYTLDTVEDSLTYDAVVKLSSKKTLNDFKENDTLYTLNKIEDLNVGTEKTNVNILYYITATGLNLHNIDELLAESKNSKIISISKEENSLEDFNELNSLIEPDEYLMDNASSKITILVKNATGKKELFKLISHIHLNRITDRGVVVLKSDITKELRDNCLIGSAGTNGFFKQVYEKGNHTINPDFYDYFEIQPKNAYLSISDNENVSKNIVDTVSKIYNYTKKNNKLLVIDTDAYYLTKNEKEFRKIYTKTKFAGNIHHLCNVKEIGDNYLYGTKALKNQISVDYPFMQNDINEVIIENPNKIYDMIEDNIQIVSKTLYAPLDDFFKEKSKEYIGHQVDSCKTELENIVNEALKKYEINGKLPEYIQARVDKELKSIIGNGYYSNYYISYLLVKRSNDDGYVVGSRGSVGSSFVANLMGITEVNALKPHYYCPNCHYQLYKGEKEIISNPKNKELFINLDNVTDGYDLKDANCPCCNHKLLKDGHDIPFETFLGFNGDKVPDIDLNFSGVYQPKAMDFLREVFGPTKSFRAGTIGTVAEKTAQQYVMDYNKLMGIESSKAEIIRKGKHLEEVKRTTGQHAGGIIVLPSDKEIYDFTPVQYPANSDEKEITTHFEYHGVLDEALLKFDILGHDDPTMLKFLMDNVKKHPEEYPFSSYKEIPFTDEKVIALLKEDSKGFIDSLGISEFGTNFVTNMLHEINPNNFADLVKVSGLSHGTDVWNNNSQELVKGTTDFGKIDFAKTIGCRDDIMVQLMEYGLNPSDAFDIMEFVRKGKLYKGGAEKWAKYKEILKEHNVPEWYVWSCEQIKYMFPKAHAVAYVLSALRIAWFKAYKPLDFYQAMFTVRADKFDAPSISTNDVEVMEKRIDEIRAKGKLSASDDDTIHFIELAIEMVKKGFRFAVPSINCSHATEFIKKDNKTLLLPFTSLKGVGESLALKVFENRTTPYKDLEDFKNRGKANKTFIDALNSVNALKFD